MKRDIVLYAEPLFAEAVTDQLGLILLEPPPEWLPGLPAQLVQRRISICTLGEARSMAGPVFVKPAEGKVFEARVYGKADELPSPEQVDDSLAVLVSEPVTWQLEVRCFVLEGLIATLSPYWRCGQLAEGQDGTWPFLAGEREAALDFAQRVIDGAPVPPAFVLDIGITAEHGWAVIEGNPCWGAGLYGCSPLEALRTGRRAVRRQPEITARERIWVSPRVRGRLT
jgi:hypothetical protein